jgi:hypothetical protein
MHGICNFCVRRFGVYLYSQSFVLVDKGEFKKICLIERRHYQTNHVVVFEGVVI